jgi:hypothetical protein
MTVDHAKLVAAIGNIGVKCDRLVVFDSYEDLPLSVRSSVRIRLDADESYVVAWRGHRCAFSSLTPELIERASLALVAEVICGDLTAELDAETAQ